MNPAKRKPPLNVLRLSPYRLIKRTNSKGDLARACLQYQKALMWYANESHWAVKDESIMWVGDDDPTKVAEILLGKRRPDSGQNVRNNAEGQSPDTGATTGGPEGSDRPAGQEPRSAESPGDRSSLETVARTAAANVK